jgi:hypothetical protein
VNNALIETEIAAKVASLPSAARPYLLALTLAEQGLSPFLEDLFVSLLADAADLIGVQHLALVAVHVCKRSGNAEESVQHWQTIDAAGTADAARAACVFMAGLPSLIRAMGEMRLH